MQDVNREPESSQDCAEPRSTRTLPDQRGPRHQWQTLPVGRVCLFCQVVQAKDEFDDTMPCKAS